MNYFFNGKQSQHKNIWTLWAKGADVSLKRYGRKGQKVRTFCFVRAVGLSIVNGDGKVKC